MSDNTKFQYDVNGLPVPASLFSIKIVESNQVEVTAGRTSVILGKADARFIVKAILSQTQYDDLPSGVAVGRYGPGIIIRDTSRDHHIDLTQEAAQDLAKQLSALVGE